MSLGGAGAAGGARSPVAWAAALSVVWLVAAGVAWATLGPQVVLAAALLAPVGLLWLGVAVLRGRDAAEQDRAGLRGEIASLRDEMRRAAPVRPAEERRAVQPPEGASATGPGGGIGPPTRRGRAPASAARRRRLHPRSQLPRGRRRPGGGSTRCAARSPIPTPSAWCRRARTC